MRVTPRPLFARWRAAAAARTFAPLRPSCDWWAEQVREVIPLLAALLPGIKVLQAAIAVGMEGAANKLRVGKKTHEMRAIDIQVSKISPMGAALALRLVDASPADAVAEITIRKGWKRATLAEEPVAKGSVVATQAELARLKADFTELTGGCTRDSDGTWITNRTWDARPGRNGTQRGKPKAAAPQGRKAGGAAADAKASGGVAKATK
eukprot:gene34341-3631_t